MSNFTNIQNNPLIRLQRKQDENRLIQLFRANRARHRRAAAKAKVANIRHWQDGGFVSLPLSA